MTENQSPSVPPARARSRYGFVLFFALSLLVAFTVLRGVLCWRFTAGLSVPAGDLAKAFAIGFHRDLVVAAFSALALFLWFRLVPDRWFPRPWHRRLVVGGMFVFWMVQIFTYAAEFFFFDEFKSRFNTVAVDYLLYPHEVFFNIWESYPVLPVVLVCALLSIAWLTLAHLGFRGMWDVPVTAGRRTAWLVGGAVVALGLGLTINLRAPRFSQERVVNEIANNGPLSFLGAALTRHLDFGAFYKTIPREEGYERARQQLAQPGVEFIGGADSIRRRIPGEASRPRLNVVILIEESLGSKFFGSLGRQEPTLTPEMDRLAETEAWLFTNIYATGNRTVRGLEGVLSSFPPLPGDSIVWRDRSQHVETLARLLRRDGYRTLFLYGGRGLFDRMDTFMLDNGFERFIERKDFAKPTFTTVWGVCDEDLFDRSIEEFRELHRQGQPFFGVALTVSNHEPFTYPKGRIPEDPDERRRGHAVKYSDYALGRFFRQVKDEPFYKDTIFVVVADHGDRVYGSQTVPIPSYMIPWFILGPAVVDKPARLPHLGGSMDVAPTVLGLIGRPYESTFLGRDLLKDRPETARAMLQHNRDVGLYAAGRMVTFGLRQSVEFYQGDPKLTNPQRMENPTALEVEFERDAISLFQVADELYVNQRYRIDAP